MIQEKVSRSFACVCQGSVFDLETVLQFVNLCQELHPLSKHEVDPSVAAKIFLCLQSLFSVAQSKQVSLVDVECHDFLKELIEGLIGVGDDEGSLLWVVVIEVGDDLHGNVRLSSARGTHNHR